MISLKGTLKDVFSMANGNILITLDAIPKNASMQEFEDLKQAKNGVKIELQKWREKRSINANNYFHLLVNEIAEVMQIGNDECKIKMNLEYGTVATDKKGNKVIVKMPSDVDVSQFYDYAKFIAEKEEKGLKLSYYLFYKQTHTLDTKEMSRLINGVVEEAKALNIDVRTPNEIAEMLSLWEQDME